MTPQMALTLAGSPHALFLIPFLPSIPCLILPFQPPTPFVYNYSILFLRDIYLPPVLLTIYVSFSVYTDYLSIPNESVDFQLLILYVLKHYRY